MVLCFLLLLFCSFTLQRVLCASHDHHSVDEWPNFQRNIWILSSIYFYRWKRNLLTSRSISCIFTILIQFDIRFALFHFAIFNTYSLLTTYQCPFLTPHSPHHTLRLLFFLANRFPHSFVLSIVHTLRLLFLPPKFCQLVLRWENIIRY